MQIKLILKYTFRKKKFFDVGLTNTYKTFSEKRNLIMIIFKNYSIILLRLSYMFLVISEKLFQRFQRKKKFVGINYSYIRIFIIFKYLSFWVMSL